MRFLSHIAAACAALLPGPVEAWPQEEKRRIEVGERVSSKLGGEDSPQLSYGPERGYRLVLDRGPVTISLESFDFDAVLRVEDEAGELIAEDDDSGIESDARLVLDASLSGSTTIWARSKAGGGEFTLAILAGAIPALSGAALADAAIDWRHNAAERAMARGDRKSAARHQVVEGSQHRALSQLDEARVAFEAALTLFRELDDRRAEISTVGHLGDLYISLGDHQQARELFEQYIVLSRELGDRGAEAWGVTRLGTVYDSLGDYPRARELFDRYLALTRELGNRAGEAWALGRLGGFHKSRGHYPRAREFLDRAVLLERELDNRAGEAWALGQLGELHDLLGEPLRAREHFQQYLDLVRQLDDRAGEVWALGRIGKAHLSLGDFARAREFLEQQLALERVLGNRIGEAWALGNLGLVCIDAGEFRRAQAHFEEQLAISTEVGDRSCSAEAFSNLGQLSYTLNDIHRAQQFFEKHLALARDLGSPNGEATALGNLGNTYLSLADLPRARECFEQSGALFRELGVRRWETWALGQLGIVFENLGDHGRARDLYEEYLASARELDDRRLESGALSCLGDLHNGLGEHQRARQAFEQALALARTLGWHDAEAELLRDLAVTHLELGDAEEAGRLARLADDLARELGVCEIRIQALGTLARASIALNRSAAALEAVEEAEHLLEELPTGGLSRDHASGLRGRFARLGRVDQDLAAVLLAEAGEAPGARSRAIARGFGAAGRWKGRALLEGIAEHRSGARSAAAIELMRDRRAALAVHAMLLERVSRSIYEERPFETTEGLRDDARAELDEVVVLTERLRELSPQDGTLDLPPGTTVREVRDAVLGHGDLLVEFMEGEEFLYGYVLGEASFEMVKLGLRAEISAELNQFLGGIRHPGQLADAAEIADTGGALFARLLAPALAAAEAPVERLIIVPSASLAALPFEALVIRNPGAEPRSFDQLEFVLDRFELTYGPSSPVLVELAAVDRRAEGGRILLLADPRYPGEAAGGPAESIALAMLDDAGTRALPDPASLPRLPKTRTEAFAIADKLVPEESDEQAELERLRASRDGSLETTHLDMHLGSASSRERLAGDLRQYAVVHLACHGFIDPDLPQRSGIALSASGGVEGDPQGVGWFTIRDALELDLDADLVVLSACETARGEPKAGEGVESLARAFLYSGARGLVASLWQVEDRAAALTMATFYAGWLEGNLPPAAALREAKLALRRNRVEPDRNRSRPISPVPGRGMPTSAGHPYYWAPFIHIGLPGPGTDPRPDRR